MSRFFKLGRLVLYLILFLLVARHLFGGGTYTLDKTVRLVEGTTISSLYTDMGWMKKMKLKRFMKKYNDEVTTSQPGSYVLSGSYRAQEILDTFLDGPQLVYEHITLLEGWSIYDIDNKLSRDGLIESGAYITFVQDPAIIDRYRQRYDFLQQAFDEREVITSLEGYLYPDTYFVDIDKNVIDQLVYLQLEGFNTKIWTPYGEQLRGLTDRLRGLGYNFTLSTYGALILASIVEKEERVDSNRPVITSVFYNRLDTGMRIDADISLCYGLQEGYETCTPAVIVQHLRDTSNPYNTRAVPGLPPTPIVSPTASSVSALLEAEKSNDFFYLHAPDGTLHTAVDNAGHVRNKQLYLE